MEIKKARDSQEFNTNMFSKGESHYYGDTVDVKEANNKTRTRFELV